MNIAEYIYTAATLIAGVAVFLFWFHRIFHKYSKQTPVFVRIGAALFAAGALLFLVRPEMCGRLMLFGSALIAMFDRRARRA